MLFGLNIWQAIVYPYRGENWKNTLAFPGFIAAIVMLAMFLLNLFLSTFLAFVLSGRGYDETFTKLFANGFAFWLSLPVLTILVIPLLGFQWRMYELFQQNGLEVKAPSWRKEFKTYLKDGLILCGFYLLMQALLWSLLALLCWLVWVTFGDAITAWCSLSRRMCYMFALIVAMVLLTAGVLLFPLAASPVVYTAADKKFKSLFQWGAMIRRVQPRYGYVLLATLVMILLALVYAVLCFSVLVATCCIGVVLLPALVGGGFTVTSWHLLAQAFREE